MGISDREYYRDETRGSGWFSGVAPVTKWIIIVNVAMFVLQKLYPPIEILLEGSSVAILKHGQIWRLLTATFLHNPDALWHILFNMMFLWMVGREMEAFYGSRDFLVFYISAAIFSTLGWAILDYASGFPGSAIGASGAVTAVMVVYTMYYPNREVVLYIFPMKMWVLLIVFLGFDLLQLISGTATKIAVAGHLAGALYGYLFKVADLRLTRLLRLVSDRRKPKLRVIMPDRREPREPRESVSPSRPNPAGNGLGGLGSGSSVSSPPAPAKPSGGFHVVSQEQLDARLDEVLAKIARDGNKNGLTEEELRVLDEASARARSRRRERI